MMDPERVKQLSAEGLPCEGLHVQGDGQHFEALIVSSLFEGKTRRNGANIAPLALSVAVIGRSG